MAHVLTLLSVLASSAKRHSLLSLCRGIDYWSDNPEPSDEDIEIAGRIIEFYRTQETNSRRQSGKKRGLWEGLVAHDRRRYIELMSRGEKYGLAAMLRSFRRNGGATGIAALGRVLLNRWGLRDNSHEIQLAYDEYARLLVRRAQMSQLNKLELSSDVGNPYFVDIDGSPKAVDLLFFGNVAYELFSLIDLAPERNHRFLNIGAGFGGLEYQLSQLLPQARFAIVDLPEILIFPMYYLSRQYPDRRLACYTGSENLADLLKESDILLIPDWAVGDLPDKSFDVVMNRNALENIPRQTAVDYVRRLPKLLNDEGWFYSHNQWGDYMAGDEGNGIRDLMAEANVSSAFLAPKFFGLAPSSPQSIASAAYRKRKAP